ncbi:MAG: MoaD/ThiS family protein [Flavobacteriaceae bacterium]|nr:MoaD/ThiS family protein [Flavobacteriaceae bacterium]MDZ4147173.1 MoaD/ThiS family protein [Flavobacteriaceae bacterium]
MEILLFGITKNIVGASTFTVPASKKSELGIADVASLKGYLKDTFPGLRDINSLAVAVNNQYASDHTALKETDEIALIPPVSGG